MIPVELILLGLSPIFLACVLIEFFKAKQHYNIKDSINNAFLALLHQGTDAFVLLLLMPVFNWLHQFAVFDIQLTVVSLLIGFILQDFLYYWFHRASHNIHWFWLAHVVHHSSTHMNFTTAFRQRHFVSIYRYVVILAPHDFDWIFTCFGLCHCGYQFGLSVFCSHPSYW